MSRSLARSLVIAALACFSLIAAGGIASAAIDVQGSNTADSSASLTGDTGTENANGLRTGPTALSTDSQASQSGDNTGSVSQRGATRTGDAVAGSAVIGAVGNDVTVQSQNDAFNPFALSGSSAVTNFAFSLFGPNAQQASQVGSNALELAQDGSVATGDALAGSQVAGVVGGGQHNVQLQNIAFCGGTTAGQSFDAGCAFSGTGVVTNLAFAQVGPTNTNSIGVFSNGLGSNGTSLGALGTGPTTEPQVSQIGDNDAVISQGSAVTTGDALFGSQVAGTVGGSANVQNQNDSECDAFACATSGQAGLDIPTNFAIVLAGPSAASAGDVQVSQNGDNSVDVSQTADASSGDALSGSQVTGMVSEEAARLTVQNQQASEGDSAVTGQAFAENVNIAIAGPLGASASDAEVSQIGDNSVVNDQVANAITGDAVAGSQITGIVGGAGSEVTVQNQNSAGAPIAPIGATAFSGDAVAAAQITGVVTGPDSITDIQVQNDATGDGTTSAFADFSLGTNVGVGIAGPWAAADGNAQSGQVGDNSIDSSQVGNDIGIGLFVAAPIASGPAIALSATDGIVYGRATEAQATQNGDNAVTATQENVSASGDAVAGSQVTGSVSGEGSETGIQAQNTAEDAFARSGDIPIVTVLAAGLGPVAVAGLDAQSSQIGDNAADLGQIADAATGDAVAGSQVTGSVGGDTTAQAQLESDDAEAISGFADAPLVLFGTAGGFANSVFESALATHSGDSDIAGDQAGTSASGDALGGAQVSGVVDDS